MAVFKNRQTYGRNKIEKSVLAFTNRLGLKLGLTASFLDVFQVPIDGRELANAQCKGEKGSDRASALITGRLRSKMRKTKLGASAEQGS